MKLLIVSTSKIHGQGYLDYLEDELVSFFSKGKNITFIPFARPSGITWDEYTAIARPKFEKLGFNLKGIHEFDSIHKGLENADGIFTGGGNTFLLLKTLYEKEAISMLRNAVDNGLPYMGSSAGSNITGPSIKTTNDMPIVYPPSFEALGFVPFQINPHYLDPDPSSKHMGETRETRINEFLNLNDSKVLGLREGSWLRVEGKTLELKGAHTARYFEKGKDPIEIEIGEHNWLLNK